jgi:hypothetical protein
VRAAWHSAHSEQLKFLAGRSMPQCYVTTLTKVIFGDLGLDLAASQSVEASEIVRLPNFALYSF